MRRMRILLRLSTPLQKFWRHNTKLCNLVFRARLFHKILLHLVGCDPRTIAGARITSYYLIINGKLMELCNRIIGGHAKENTIEKSELTISVGT